MPLAGKYGFSRRFRCAGNLSERAVETGAGPTKVDGEEDRDAMAGFHSALTPVVEGESDSLSPLGYLWIGLPLCADWG